MAPITVAIAGANGLTGVHIVRAFLSATYYPHAVGRVIALVRNASSPAALELQALGAELQPSIPSVDAFKGVDAFINTLDGLSSVDVRDAFARAAAEAGVKVYISSEFGFDNERTPNKAAIFVDKIYHDGFARALNGGSLKVIPVLNAMFLEWALGTEHGPSLGLDVKARTLTAVGSPDQKMTLTSLIDIASTVVQLSLRATKDRNSVPNRIRISGDIQTYNQLADIIRSELGGEVSLKSIDAEEFKNSVEPDLYTALRLRFAAGDADFSENDNELINPGESLWKWKKAPEFVKEFYGGHVIRLCLSPTYYPHAVNRLIGFTRDASSASALELKAMGVEVYAGEPTAESLKGVDVLVNTLNADAPGAFRDVYAKAAAEAGVKQGNSLRLVLSDHYTNHYAGEVFVTKKAHDSMARAVNGGSLKVITLMTGIYIEFDVGSECGPEMGVDVKNRVVTAIGSLDNTVTFNSVLDVASTIVRLSIMAAADRNSVPDRVRINGDAKSYNEVADILRQELAVDIAVKSIDPEEYNKVAESSLFKDLRLGFSSGTVNFSKDNHNELVNPGGTLWKWKSVTEFVREHYAGADK